MPVLIYSAEYLSSIRLNQKEKIVPRINIAIEKIIAVVNVRPDSASPSRVSDGKTVVGKIANEDPTTIPRMKWYIFE